MTFTTSNSNSAADSVLMSHSSSGPVDDRDYDDVDEDDLSNASLDSISATSDRMRYHIACGTVNPENRERLRRKASARILKTLEAVEKDLKAGCTSTQESEHVSRFRNNEYSIYCELSRRAGDLEPVTSMAPEEENWVKSKMEINERAKLASLGDPWLCSWEASQMELDQYDMDRYQVLQEAARRLKHDTHTLSNADYVLLVQERQREGGDDYAFEPTPTGMTRGEEIEAMHSLLKVDATNYSSAMNFSKQAASNWPKGPPKAVAKYRARQNVRAEILQAQHWRLCEADAKKSKEALIKEPSWPATMPAGDVDITKSSHPNDWESQTAQPYIPDPDPSCPPSDYSSPSPPRLQHLRRLGRLLFGRRGHQASPNGLSRDASSDQRSLSEKGI